MFKRIGRFLDAAVAVTNPAKAAGRLRDRLRFEQLSVYDAARRDRTNRDWRAVRGSADAAIMPDLDVLRDRSRSLVRDNWIANSAVQAYGRNVVGRGIMPVATVKGDDGKELEQVNERLDTRFVEWARKRSCDVCRKQSFWQKQRMAVQEMIEAGEHFWIWSYEFDPRGKVPGLRLQSFEPEQLDIVKLVNPVTGNEVRRGVEIDPYGAPVAYHFYDRPLNDYYGFQPAGTTASLIWESKPYPADRVFHFMQQQRVRQTHGVPRLAPSVRRIRDVDTYDEATLLSAKTEAMPALQINRSDPVGQGMAGLVAGGGTGTGPGGEPDYELAAEQSRRRIDFEPAMVFEALPGEQIQVVQKQNGGANYAAFMEANVGAAAAGAGLSRSVVAHDYTKGTYSGERQGALQDNREYGCYQDLIDDELQTLWELYVRFSVLEDAVDGRYGLGIDLDEFTADPQKFYEVEWVPDGLGWVDPAKEAAGDAIALENLLTTRKDIIARRFGKNWRRVWQQRQDEALLADELGLVLPENVPAVPPDEPDGDGEKPAPPPAASAKPAKGKPGRRTAALVDAILLTAARTSDDQA